MSDDKRRLYRDHELAKLGLVPWSAKKLQKDRHYGRRIPYIKVGKSVCYDINDVYSYLEKFKIIPEDNS